MKHLKLSTIVLLDGIGLIKFNVCGKMYYDCINLEDLIPRIKQLIYNDKYLYDKLVMDLYHNYLHDKLYLYNDSEIFTQEERDNDVSAFKDTLTLVVETCSEDDNKYNIQFRAYCVRN